MGTLSAAAFVATWLSVLVAVAGAFVVLGAGFGLVMFFRAGRRTRLARHESVGTYYLHHAFAH